jgi:hypothetical protein
VNKNRLAPNLVDDGGQRAKRALSETASQQLDARKSSSAIGFRTGKKKRVDTINKTQLPNWATIKKQSQYGNGGVS